MLESMDQWIEAGEKVIMRFVFCVLNLLVAACATSVNFHESGKYQVLTVRRSYSNSHIVKFGDKNYLMVDSGSYEDAPLLEQDMRGYGIQPEWIRAIVLTHAHWDHAGGARYFQERYNTPILLGAKDQPLLEKGRADELCPTSFIARLRRADDQEKSFLPAEPSRLIQSKTLLDEWAGPGVGFIATVPSHTPGSLAVVVGDMAFVGDLFRGSIIGSQATRHFYICDLSENTHRISEFIKQEASGSEYFFTGHFGPVLLRSAVEEFARNP